jgi:hypothetical protein
MAIHTAQATLSGTGAVLKVILPPRFAVLQVLAGLMRQDSYAVGYYPKSSGKFKYDTVSAPLTDDDLRQHLAGTRWLGGYPMSAGSDVTKFAAYDIDDHAGAKEWDDVATVALRIVTAAKPFGLNISSVRSGGGHGIHLLIWWDKPQRAADVRALMATILESAALVEDDNDGVGIEIFPKQDHVEAAGYGNLIALPFARKSVPLDRDMQPIAEPALWFSSISVPPAPKPEPEPDDDQFPPDMGLAREALTFIDARPHKVWIDVGLALKHDFGDAGYSVWLEWSKTCPDKFRDVEDPKKVWDGFHPRKERPITCGSIYRWARKAGWAGPHSYEERNGGFCLVKRTDDEATRIKLSNFVVKIVEDVTVDNGSDFLQREVIVEYKDGRAVVPAEQFDALGWVMPVLGAKAVIAPEARLKGHVVAAIKHLSRPTRRTIYAHFGWRRIGDRRLYLHSDGAIGADGPVEGIEVRAGANLSAYSLPAVHDNQPPAILASLSLVELCPEIMWPLLGGVYRAPLGEWCPVTTSLLFTGATGVGKTTAAMLGQNHFGIFSRVPADWSSTANALERMAFITKDAVLLIDDFVPKATRGDVQQLLAKAERVFRGAANRSGRGRLNQRLTFQPEYFPRGLVLATGEDVPMGESLRARIVIVEVGKGSIPIGDQLDKAQAMARAGLYAQAITGYIQWLAGQDHLGLRLTARQNALRGEATGTHARTPENIASLMLGVETLLQYAKAVEAITPQQSEAYRQSAWGALQGQGKVQEIYLAEETPARRFTALIRSVISSGRGHVADADGGGEPRMYAAALGWQFRWFGKDGSWQPQGRLVGWLEVIEHKGPVIETINLPETINLYLDPETAYAEAQALASAEGRPLPVGAKTLWKRLDEAGLLVSKDADHQTLRRTIWDTRRRVLHLDGRKILGLEGHQGQGQGMRQD